MSSYNPNRQDQLCPILIYLNRLATTARYSSHPEQQLAAIQAVRRFLSSSKFCTTSDLTNSDILPTLTECLEQHTNAMLQFEAAWALTNIASGTSEHTSLVVAIGAVPRFVELLSSPAPEVREQATWALGNIIGDGPELRDNVIEQGVVQRLLGFIKSDIPISFLRTVTWVLVNLCRYNHPPPPANTIVEILPALNILIQHSDIIVLVNAVWGIGYLANGGNDQIQMVIESNVVPKLVSLLDHIEVKVKMAALRAVGNIVTGSDEQAQVVLNHDALLYIPALLTHTKEKIRKLAIWFMANITAGNRSQVQAAIDVGLLSKIMEILCNGEFQAEKAWIITNVTANGNRDQVFTLIREGIIPSFCELLASQDTRLLNIVLNGLNNMLIVAESFVLDVAKIIHGCGGKEKIERLQGHDDVDIYRMAYHITEQYFSEDCEQFFML